MLPEIKGVSQESLIRVMSPPPKLRLDALGMVVCPRTAWPAVRAKFCRVERLAKGSKLHTVQSTIYTRFVDDKATAISSGSALAVKVVLVGGVPWVFDGHHTYAGYVFLDRQPLLAVFMEDAKGDVIQPPKLFR